MIKIFILLLINISFVFSQEIDSSFIYKEIDSLTFKKEVFNDSLQSNKCFKISHDPLIYDSIINLKASICEGTLLYVKNSLSEKRKKEFPDSIIIEKTSSLCFFQKINDSIKELGCLTFIIDFKTNFHVVSLIINNKDFLGESRGIYAKGHNAVWDTIEKRHMNANFGKKWERKLNVEIFNSKNIQILNQNSGVRIFGGMTKYGKEKSLRLIAREQYGKKRFNADLFGVGEKKYKQFVLRHSGNDHNNTRFKDSFLTSIISEEGTDVQKSTPAHLFINAEYWGVYNIREKINDHYIINNYNIKSDSLTILQGLKTVEFGSNESYVKLRNYIKKNNLKDSIHYHNVQKEMDTRNYINWWIFQLFIANNDARGNIRFWKSGLLDNKFRWIVYDTDLGFELGDHKNNMIKNFTSPYMTHWYNPQWATFLLRNLLKNKDFETDFINQFFWLKSSKLNTEYLTNRIDWFENIYDDEMKIHFTRAPNKSMSDRWYHLERIGRNYDYWKKEVNKLKLFAIKRPAYFLKHLKQKFKIETYLLNLNIVGKEHGTVLINKNILEKSNLTTLFSKNHKLPINVIPNEGYQTNFNQKFIRTKKDTLDINITFEKIPKKYWWRED